MSFLFLFWHRNPSNYVIRLGDHNRHRNEGTEQNIGASRVIKHPQYDSRRINNDIALLKLSRAANINDRVLPACLPRANYIVPAGTTCYITGQFSLQPNRKKSQGPLEVRKYHQQRNIIVETTTTKLPCQRSGSRKFYVKGKFDANRASLSRVNTISIKRKGCMSNLSVNDTYNYIYLD